MPVDDVQTEILQRLTRVETKLDMQLNAKDLASEALDKAKSAHHRVDDINKRIDEVAADIKWLWRTVIATIISGAISGGIALLWKGVGS
ncbi:hemolysin XhlA family protein [Cohnella abietis]|uniref:Hemolysin XhlA n=1 Tax=Cohnella abietis TaxID=2507935 RepID=A0A3T1D2P0_9BACL|nr:hemolysin XhlA family protein [Cohnella abietis]BBI32377.1 hypothetical protein KCTCHS21_17760 [Cohnella abietis]